MIRNYPLKDGKWARVYVHPAWADYVNSSFGGWKMYGGDVVATEACDIQRSSLSDRLQAEEDRLTARLLKINQVRKALDANPEVKFVIDGLAELGHV